MPVDPFLCSCGAMLEHHEVEKHQKHCKNYHDSGNDGYGDAGGPYLDDGGYGSGSPYDGGYGGEVFDASLLPEEKTKRKRWCAVM
jgi:hypothetical protein